jgi:hypothetical protein
MKKFIINLNPNRSNIFKMKFIYDTIFKKIMHFVYTFYKI